MTVAGTTESSCMTWGCGVIIMGGGVGAGTIALSTVPGVVPGGTFIPAPRINMQTCARAPTKCWRSECAYLRHATQKSRGGTHGNLHGDTVRRGDMQHSTWVQPWRHCDVHHLLCRGLQCHLHGVLLGMLGGTGWRGCQCERKTHSHKCRVGVRRLPGVNMLLMKL